MAGAGSLGDLYTLISFIYRTKCLFIIGDTDKYVILFVEDIL